MKTLILLFSLLFCLNGFAADEPADKGAESVGSQLAVAEKDPAKCEQLLADLGPAASAGELVSVPSAPPTRPMADSLPENVIAIKGLAKDLSSKMLASGLIHSDFFSQAIIRNIPSTVDENGAALYVSGLNSVQMNTLANKIYEDMMAASENASNGLSTVGLHDAALASEIINKTPAPKVIDKVGEALVLAATNGAFINFFDDLESKVIAQSNSGKIKLIAFSGVTLIAGIGAIIQTGDASLIELAGWYGVVAFSGIKAIGNRSGRVIRQARAGVLRDLENQTSSMKTALSGYTFFQNPDKQRIAAQLDQIESFLQTELKKSQEQETEDYQIGRATGEIRRELSRLYHVEFSKWVSATQFKTIELLRNFQTIFESDQRDQQFHVFENIIGEALEVTDRIRKLNRQLIQSLNADITKIENLTPDEMQESAYGQMVLDLKTRKLSQEQFEATLLLVIESFRSTLVAARSVREADMNLLTSQILEALKGKSKLEEMDQENPIVVLLNSVQGLNVNLGNLGITPDQARIGLGVTDQNLQNSVDKCIEMANESHWADTKDSILFDCFKKLKEHLNVEQCQSLALTMHWADNKDTMLQNCVNKLDQEVSGIEPENCRELAKSAHWADTKDSILFSCYKKLKNTMSLEQCQKLANTMHWADNKDSLMGRCINGN